MKTIKEWLEELPEPYRTQALENVSEYSLSQKDESLSEALKGAFTWIFTPQGHYYWMDLRDKLKLEGK